MLMIEEVNEMHRIVHEALEEFEKPEAYCNECHERLTDFRPGKRDDVGLYHCQYCIDNNVEMAKKYLDEEFYENLIATIEAWTDWED